MKPVLVIGRKKTCDIILSGDTVSRVHANLTLEHADSGILEDADSTSGTFVRDSSGWQRIYRATIHVGEVLRFGDLEMDVADLFRLIPAARLAEIQATGQREPDRQATAPRYSRDPETGIILKN